MFENGSIFLKKIEKSVKKEKKNVVFAV